MDDKLGRIICSLLVKGLILGIYKEFRKLISKK